MFYCVAFVGVKIWLYFVPTRVTRPAQFSISAERAFHYILGVILSAGAISLSSRSAEHELLYLLFSLSHKIDIDHCRVAGSSEKQGKNYFLFGKQMFIACLQLGFDLILSSKVKLNQMF